MKLKAVFNQTIATVTLSLFVFAVHSQNHYYRFENIDIQHYTFEIHLNDSTNRIEGKTTITANLLKPVQQISLDLVGLNDSTQTGMRVASVTENENPLQFAQQNNRLEIRLTREAIERKKAVIQITYSGIPADGLIISKNKFGDRTFFGDNWPNRARHWLPTVDHPSDKATLEFLIFAPQQYQVISNGNLFETTNLSNHMNFTHWKEDVPLSTKLMVIGVARFAVRYNNAYKPVPVSSWVFPQNSASGFSDYAIGAKALQYFSEIVGPFSYEKLAHVQSKTRYGGMENASCIFYSERTVNGKNQQERLFAHETAHQWFGNSVTEQNWHHIWLSEGFATYFTHIYNQHFLGETEFKNGLKNDRKRVIAYAQRRFAPIIDTTVTDYNRLLNANSYQKASWFLHMLREKLGDEVFFEGIQKYYHDFRNSTALTRDFRSCMEEVSGQKLRWFFDEWLRQPGHPKIAISWQQNTVGKAEVRIEQVQPDYLFTFPLEIEIRYKNGESTVKTIEVKAETVTALFEVDGTVQSIVPDPNVKLLFEEL